MAGGRPIFALVAFLLVAGGIVLDIFVILSGAIQSSPMNKVYFLEANTAGIGSSPTNAAWTYFSLCTYSGGSTSACGNKHPAFPFNPPQASNFGTTVGVPQEFIGTHEYYYLSRFAWSFYLVSLFFAAIALFTGILALCTRIGSYLSGLNAATACFFQGLTAALMTAWTIKARNAFRAAGIASSIGRYAYGFTWAAFVCFFLAMILFCAGGSAGRKQKKEEHIIEETPATRRGFFGRQGRQGSRGSRVDGVKDDYSTPNTYA